ncbi:MAG: glycoside hydrolase family 3 N-terminal domain-containing protein [Spirulinaceae cyanobacterium]
MTRVGKVLLVLGAIAMAILGFYLRSLFMSRIRDVLWWVGLGLSLGLFAIALFWNLRLAAKISDRFSLAIVTLALAIFLGQALQFQWQKYRVLNTDSAVLQELGQHFIVGYRDLQEIEKLVQREAVGGIFITKRNIKNKTKTEIKQEIAKLQQIRRENNLNPLWVATDQEGGIVSRLSPPLTLLPPISQVVAAAENEEMLQAEVEKYAAIQGRELADLGINLNFAPVVDLNKNLINPEDKYSKIYKRAISSDADVVTQVASWYCQTLAQYRVYCTLKHFPGLGRVAEDTHLETASLSTPIAVLQKEDWLPFQKLMQNPKTVTMLGHVNLTELDADRAVSFSEKVMGKLLREKWQYDGILVTDDFCMQAVYRSELGIEKAAIAALNAGVDLILIAYDPSLYYPAINAVLNADKQGKMNRDRLQSSQLRLQGFGL